MFCGRLDAVETIGAVIEEVAVGAGGVRPAAAAADVPHTTARGWLRRFAARAARVSVAFAALAVELGGEVLGAIGDGAGQALAAIGDGLRGGAPRWRAGPRWAGGGSPPR